MSHRTEVIESAIRWMENTAADDSHGYDQEYRWGERGDYDCSSAVITAWKKAGIPLTCTYTGNMRADMLSRGFKDVTNKVNLATGAGLERGDVLLNEIRHVAMYCGDGMEVESSINELGRAVGGLPGDQTSREFLVRQYRNFPWDCVLRYSGGGVEFGTDERLKEFRPQEIAYGDYGDHVAVMQAILRALNYLGANNCPLEIDGENGLNTTYALTMYQGEAGLVADGICGAKTWARLLGKG